MSFGNRNWESLYEFGTIESFNDDGSIDVLIPGRDFPYGGLKTTMDTRALSLGDKVVVGKAYGSPWLPFILGDTASFKKTIRTGFDSPAFNRRGAWQQMESTPELSCLAWLQSEIWNPMALTLTELIDLTTFGLTDPENDPPFGFCQFGGNVMFQPFANPRNQVAALFRRIAPEGDPEDPTYPSEKALFGVVCYEPDTMAVQWSSLATEAGTPIYIDDFLSARYLHHDPFGGRLIAFGPESDKFIYVWSQDGDFLKKSELAHNLRHHSVCGELLVKCWYNGDESDPTTLQDENIILAYKLTSGFNEYNHSWSITPKDLLSLTFVTTQPYIYDHGPYQKTVFYQQSSVRDYGFISGEPTTLRFPISPITNNLAVFAAGHEGLNWWFEPFPYTTNPTASSLEDRTRNFQWEFSSMDGPSQYVLAPGYRLSETRQAKMVVASIDFGGLVQWKYIRTVDASSDPVKDTTIMANITPTDPFLGSQADLGLSAANSTNGTNLGWATHGLFPALAPGVLAGGLPQAPHPYPDYDEFNFNFPYNVYYYPVPDYRVLAIHNVSGNDPHGATDVDFKLHPAGLVMDQQDGDVVFAVYEPYQILCPGGVNGTPIQTGQYISGSSGNIWHGGAVGVTLNSYTFTGTYDHDENPLTPPANAYSIDYDYAGILQQQLWNKTILIRLNNSSGLVEWETDISCYSDGYEWGFSPKSTLNRPYRLEVKQIIPYPELSRLVVIRQWMDPLADPPKPEQTVIEVREWGDGSVLYKRFELSCDPDQNVLQYDEQTYVCYDFGEPEYPHDPAGPGFCDQYGTFAAGSYVWTSTYDFPAKGGMTPDGVGWLTLSGSGTDRTFDEDFRRIVTLIMDPGLPDPYIIIEQLNVDEDRVPNGANDFGSLLFLENGSGVWSSGNKLVATFAE